MRRFISFGPAFVVLITTLVVLVGAPAAVRRLGYAAADSQIRMAKVALRDDDILERLNAAVRSIAKSVEPSVVHIQTDVSAVRGRGRRVMVSQGSGWVYDARGHIVTNAHVVSGTPGLVVQFYDGRRVPAEIVGMDVTTDVAVIRAKTSEGLFPLARASGGEVSQGDRVYAFGSPFGFKFSMSEGIVSGLGRDPTTIIGESGGGYTNYIQSDAAVNPGNSGGPLVDIKGRVVGMNVAIATSGGQQGGPDRGQSAGISFAIPLDTIESVVEQLIGSGSVAKGYLGINLPQPSSEFPDLEDYNRSLLQSAGFSGQGVVVMDVPKDGPAARAGLEAGDVITRIKNRPVNTVAGLRQAISINRPGDQVDVQVARKGEVKDFRVVLGDLMQVQQALRRTEEAVSAYGFVGMASTDDGIQVRSIRSPSRAVEDGFRPGQVIVSIEGQPITSGDALLAVLGEKGFASGQKLSAVVIEPGSRGGAQRELVMQYRP